MASTRSFPDRISYALTLGLQYTRNDDDDETDSPPPRTAEEMILGMGYQPEPSIVYTMKLKYKIDGVDWRRESRWKNVILQASDGFSLPFHGTLLRSAAEDFFSSVSLSTPEAPMENFPLPMFKTDGLLVLHDLIYKGYATIPRNLVIDILIQLSAIDPALIKRQKTDDDDEDDDSSPEAESPIPTIKTKTFKRCHKKRLTFRRRMARVFVTSSKLRSKPKLKVPMKWNVTIIPEPIESPTNPRQLPTDPVDLIPPPTTTTTTLLPLALLPPPSTTTTNNITTTFTDLTPVSTPSTPLTLSDVPQKEEPEILIIDLLTPTSTPLSSPNSKSPSYCPESSSESLSKNNSTISSSPEFPESPKSTTSTSLVLPPISSITLQPKRRLTLIPPSIAFKTSPSSNSANSLLSTSPPTKLSNRVYKRARMSTSRSSYLETILAFKRKLNMDPYQKCS